MNCNKKNFGSNFNPFSTLKIETHFSNILKNNILHSKPIFVNIKRNKIEPVQTLKKNNFEPDLMPGAITTCCLECKIISERTRRDKIERDGPKNE